MNKLTNIKKAPAEIAQLLYQNTHLMSLITSEKSSLDWNTIIANKYISLCPPLEDGTITNNRNISLIILLERINMNGQDSNIIVSGKIYVNAEMNYLLDNNYNNILLEIVNEICNSIDGVKLTSSGQVNVNSINFITYTSTRCGYSINFSFTDQNLQQVEI